MRWLLIAFLASGCAAGVRTSVHVTIEVEPPRPPAVTLDPGPPPYVGAAWVDGHWEWDGLQLVWVDGYWIELSGGSVRQPAWARTPEGWTYDAGAAIAADGTESELPPPPRPAGSVRGRSGGTVLGE